MRFASTKSNCWGTKLYREKVFTLQTSQKGLKGEEAEVANRESND